VRPPVAGGNRETSERGRPARDVFVATQTFSLLYRRFAIGMPSALSRKVELAGALAENNSSNRQGRVSEKFSPHPFSRVASMNLTLRHVVPALAGAIAIRKSCLAPAA